MTRTLWKALRATCLLLFFAPSRGAVGWIATAFTPFFKLKSFKLRFRNPCYHGAIEREPCTFPFERRTKQGADERRPMDEY